MLDVKLLSKHCVFTADIVLVVIRKEFYSAFYNNDVDSITKKNVTIMTLPDDDEGEGHIIPFYDTWHFQPIVVFTCKLHSRYNASQKII